MLKSGMIIVDRYEIIGQIGAGGMANVYKARDNKLNRYVAVKVMKSEFREDSNFIKKFTREAQAAAGLANPNIVNVFDVGEDHGIYFIVMELVEGITLKEYINKKGKLSIREATSIAIQVAMGLDAAHAQNIVHRDVKPQNIIISTDGKVKVTDFGIARAASSNTISSNAMGSVHYSSPEQVRGGYADSKSDIYSLGITLYEMITGRVPFDGDTTVAIAIKHLQDEMEAPSKYTPDMPRSLEQIIYKCTQKSPDRRYASMAGVINDLKRSLIDPNGDFVRLAPLSDHAQTVMISNAEMAAIKAGGRAVKQEEPVASSEFNSYNSTAAARKGREEIEEDRYEEKSKRRRRYEEEDDEDDEDEGYISNKLEKAMTIGGFIVGALIICILVYFIASAAGIFKFGPGKGDEDVTPTPTVEESAEGEVSVPTITGMTPEAAQELAKQYELDIIKGGEEASDTVAAGLIIRQDPEAGTPVDKNTTIKYIISTGVGKSVIPDVVNKTLSEAQALLNEEGITLINVTKENSEDIAVGNVISVNPGVGSEVNPSDSVTLVVSTGSATKMVTVPSVSGYSKAEATSMMENKGLIVSYDTGTTDRVAYGEVMSQSISGGTEVAQGTEITLTINTEPETTTPSETQTPETSEGSTTQTSTWTCNQSVGAPTNYTNGDVKLVLEQTVDGAQTTTTIYEGGAITFPYELNITGASGVTSGKVYMYELVSGTYKLRCNWPVTFTQS